MKIKAYIVDDYFVFTNYKELSSYVHDIVHHTTAEERNKHLFTIVKGELYWEKLIFLTERGKEIPVQYEIEDDFYYLNEVGIF